jgi:RimJ/RimL family protein N-acetyltransferase
MIIRDAEEEDSPLIAQLLARVIGSLDIYSAEARASEIQKYDAPSLRKMIDAGIVVVAEADDILIGACLGYEDDGLVWLSWFAVDSHYRRRGITRHMLARFTERAQQRTHKIWCDCRTSNEASIRLLENAGFERIAAVERHWYGQDFILWQKPLANS